MYVDENCCCCCIVRFQKFLGIRFLIRSSSSIFFRSISLKAELEVCYSGRSTVDDGLPSRGLPRLQLHVWRTTTTTRGSHIFMSILHSIINTQSSPSGMPKFSFHASFHSVEKKTRCNLLFSKSSVDIGTLCLWAAYSFLVILTPSPVIFV